MVEYVSYDTLAPEWAEWDYESKYFPGVGNAIVDHSEEADPTKRAELMALKTEVGSALGKLHKRHREIAHLHYYANQPVEQISQKLKIPKGTVKSRMFRMRGYLKKDLDNLI